jgi:hypothetical protein
MSKMIVYICVVWFEGATIDGGLSRCMWHESKVPYATLSECKADIDYSMDLLRLRIRQEFGDRPKGIIIEPECLEAT